MLHYNKSHTILLIPVAFKSVRLIPSRVHYQRPPVVKQTGKADVLLHFIRSTHLALFRIPKCNTKTIRAYSLSSYRTYPQVFIFSWKNAHHAKPASLPYSSTLLLILIFPFLKLPHGSLVTDIVAFAQSHVGIQDYG